MFGVYNSQSMEKINPDRMSEPQLDQLGSEAEKVNYANTRTVNGRSPPHSGQSGQQGRTPAHRGRGTEDQYYRRAHLAQDARRLRSQTRPNPRRGGGGRTAKACRRVSNKTLTLPSPRVQGEGECRERARGLIVSFRYRGGFNSQSIIMPIDNSPAGPHWSPRVPARP